MDAREHRIQLGQAAAEQLTQYLHTLSADAWHHPSACAAWEVCDVVGHLTLGAEFYASTVARGVQGDTAPPAGAPLPGVREREAASAFGPSARLRIGNVWETNCLPPSRDGLLSSTNSCRASARRIGRNPVIIPSGSARPSSLSPCGCRTGDARLGYPVCARPHSRTVPRQPPGFYGTGSRDRVVLRMQPDARRLVPLRCHFTVTGAVPVSTTCS